MGSTALSKLYKLANWKVILPLFSLFILFTLYIFPHYQHKMNTLTGADLISLDARMSYRADEVTILFDKMGVTGREVYYFISSKVDFIYPLVYGCFFILLLSNLLSKVTSDGSRWRWLALSPVIAMTFDYLENYNIQRLLTDYPIISESQVAFASVLTQSKWASLFAILVIVAGLGLKVLSLRVRKLFI